MKKAISILMVILTVFSSMMLFTASASAAKVTAFNKLASSSTYAKTYTISSSGTTIPYTNKNLTSRGTATYGKSSSSYIDNRSDEIYVYSVGQNSKKVYYAYVSYPTSNGRVKAYIPLSALTSNNGNHAAKKSSGRFYCSIRSNTALSGSYYVDKNDTVYLIATKESKYQIMYPTSNGAYRIAWCNKSDYNKYCLNKTTTTQAATSNTSYSPRTSAPSKSNGYYYSSKNIFYSSGYGMPNCTAYAYGRAYEITGKKPNLCTNSAGAWYNYNKNNGYYSYGSTPRLGAIACWSKNGTSTGHVAVVEKINSNGTVLISESHWRGTNFNTRTINSNSSNYLTGYRFMGYIYII